MEIVTTGTSHFRFLKGYNTLFFFLVFILVCFVVSKLKTLMNEDIFVLKNYIEHFYHAIQRKCQTYPTHAIK